MLSPSTVLFGNEIFISFKDLMQIGDGATGTITLPLKQGGLVAIYYLGTLVGALLYVPFLPNWR